MAKQTAAIGIALMLAGAWLAAAPQAINDPDAKEMLNYRLSLDNIQKFVAAFKAVAADSSAVCFKNNPPGDAKTLADGEKILAGCGRAPADISSAGLKPREFLVMIGAVLSDVSIVDMKRQGVIKAYPPTISPENAAFLEQNYDRVHALLAPVMGQ